MQEEKNETIADWRNEIGEQLEKLKIMDGEKAQFIFQAEGVTKTSADFDPSVAFEVLHTAHKSEDGDMTEIQSIGKTFYVSAKNFSLLKEIKDLGPLTGLKVEVGRTGKKKSDTRYTIEKVDE